MISSKTMRTRYLSTVIFLCMAGMVHAQEGPEGPDHSMSLKISYLQVKDQFNYGLTFGGLNLAGVYELRYFAGRMELGYRAELGMGAVHNKGLGIQLNLKPLVGFAGFRLTGGSERKLLLGPYLSAYYLWQMYPELQSGHLFWFASYELGPRLETMLPFKGFGLRISVSMALAAFNSRPQFQTEQYYYSSTLSDFFRNPHTHMKAGFPGSFNHAEFCIDLNRPNRSISFGYHFEYIGYRDAPTFRFMTNSLILKWMIAAKMMN